MKLRLRWALRKTGGFRDAQYYSAEELAGKTLILVANLKPARSGIESQGMILAATDESEGKLTLVTVDGDISPGAKVS